MLKCQGNREQGKGNRGEESATHICQSLRLALLGTSLAPREAFIVPKAHVFIIPYYLKNKAKTECGEEYKASILNFIKSVLTQICEK